MVNAEVVNAEPDATDARLRVMTHPAPDTRRRGSAPVGTKTRRVSAPRQVIATDARQRARQPPAARRPTPTQAAPLPELTATGAAVAATVPVGLAAILDAAISPGLGVLFGFVFILSSVFVAVLIRWRDSWAAVAIPPLVFVAAAGIASQVASGSDGDWVSRTSTDIAAAVLDHPIYLLSGTVLAAVAIRCRARLE